MLQVKVNVIGQGQSSRSKEVFVSIHLEGCSADDLGLIIDCSSSRFIPSQLVRVISGQMYIFEINGTTKPGHALIMYTCF